MMIRAASVQEADLWSRWFLYPGSIIIPIVFLHFVSLLTGLGSKQFLILGYALVAFELFLNFTGRFNTVAPRPPFRFYGVAYPLFHLYFVSFLSCAAYAHVLLFRKARISTGRIQQQMMYIGAGTAIGFCGGATTFFMSYGIHILPWGAYLVPIYILTVSYAIVRHQLLDISIVIRKTLIYSTVTAVLTAVYVLITMGLARGLSGWMPSSTAFSSGAAACAMALLFHPLRMKIQRFVDRHFFREAMDQALLREATSGFVHEIKRPLAKISLPAELSLMDLQDLSEGRRTIQEVLPKVQQRLRYILDQTADAGDRIEAIRGVSSSDAGPTEALDLAEIIRTSVAAKAELLERHGVEIKLDLEHDLPEIHGHAKQLEIVMTNLIKNAVEAMTGSEKPGERIIRITAARSDVQVTMRVEDNGPGINPENLPHLFEPYFTTKGLHGMGMGLFLCRQIVQAHGGTLDARSEPGQGAEFIVRLPLPVP